MVWDGFRLLAVDEKGGRLFEILPDGTGRVLGTQRFEKVVSLDVDPAGQIAVLDSRTEMIYLLGPDGEVRTKVSTLQLGVSKPAAVGLGRDGSIYLFDSGNGNCVRIP
jgi:hypothetical protein